MEILFLCIEQYQIKINNLNITSIYQPTVSKCYLEVKFKNKFIFAHMKSNRHFKKKELNSHRS